MTLPGVEIGQAGVTASELRPGGTCDFAGERVGCLWVVPTTQIFYRQLLYVVVIQSVASALSGSRLRWHTPPRTGAAATGLAAVAH